MLAIPNERMDVGVCDPEVQTLLIGTGEACGGYADGGLLAGFSPRTRGAQAQEQVPQQASWCKRGDRWGNRLGSAA